MPRIKKFDPEGEDYDYETAQEAGMGPSDTGHWPSREPKTGMLLKGRKHPTWMLTEEAEQKAGMEIFKRAGRYYSRPRRRVP